MLPKLYDDVPVRDGLAAERTVLAAERTFLAYMRTAFAMFVTGLTGVHLLEDKVLVLTGYVLTALSLIIMLIGGFRYVRSHQQTQRMLKRLMQSNSS